MHKTAWRHCAHATCTTHCAHSWGGTYWGDRIYSFVSARERQHLLVCVCKRATALEALRAWPGGLQMGGGVNATNAMEYLDAGASHVIVTSYVFREGRLEEDRLAELRMIARTGGGGHAHRGGRLHSARVGCIVRGLAQDWLAEYARLSREKPSVPVHDRYSRKTLARGADRVLCAVPMVTAIELYSERRSYCERLLRKGAWTHCASRLAGMVDRLLP
eukprot:88062-Pelagomonas_calceolata.AAC.3